MKKDDEQEKEANIKTGALLKKLREGRDWDRKEALERMREVCAGTKRWREWYLTHVEAGDKRRPHRDDFVIILAKIYEWDAEARINQALEDALYHPLSRTERQKYQINDDPPPPTGSGAKIASPLNGQRVPHMPLVQGTVRGLTLDHGLWLFAEQEPAPDKDNPEERRRLERLRRGYVFCPARGPLAVKGDYWRGFAVLGGPQQDHPAAFSIHLVAVPHETSVYIHRLLDIGIAFTHTLNIKDAHTLQAAVNDGYWVDKLYGGEILASVRVIRDDHHPDP